MHARRDAWQSFVDKGIYLTPPLCLPDHADTIWCIQMVGPTTTSSLGWMRWIPLFVDGSWWPSSPFFRHPSPARWRAEPSGNRPDRSAGKSGPLGLTCFSSPTMLSY